MEISFHRQAKPPAHLLRQTIDPARWGRRFRLPFQWSASKDEQIPKTVMRPRWTSLTSRPFLHEKSAVCNVTFKGAGDSFPKAMTAYVERTWDQWLGRLEPR